MAVNAQTEAQAVGQVNGYVGHINDPFGSAAGFAGEQADNVRDEALSLAEIERDPNARQAIMAQEDADTRLLGRILAERRGLRGLYSRMVESNLGRRVGLSTGVRVATSMGVGMAARAGLTAAAGVISHPLQSGLVGGITGLFTGYLRGRDQEEGASTWLAHLRILLERHGDIELSPDEDLYAALGIMANAIDDGRVRGKADTKMEMVNKMRQIKAILARRHVESRATGQPASPVMSKINAALGGSSVETARITAMAKEDLKETYGKIIGLVNNKELMTSLRGGAIGFVFGAALGKAFDMSSDFLQTAAGHAWLAAHPHWADLARLLHISTPTATGHEGGVIQDQLHAKIDALRHGQLAPEIAQHNANYSALDLQAHHGQVAPDSMWQGGEHSQVAHFERLHNSSLTPDGLDHSAGLNSSGLDRFHELLNQNQVHGVVDFANHNNIDLTTNAGNGQMAAQLILDHKEVFMNLPPDVQNFVLSHPSIAPEFLTGHGTNMAAFLGPLGGRIDDALGIAGIGAQDGILGLGAIGAGITYFGAGAAKRAEGRGVTKIYNERRDAQTREAAAAESERFMHNAQESKARLRDAQIQFLHLPAGYNLPAGRPPIFTFTHADPNGRMNFVMTDFDENIWRTQHVNPHPVVNLSQILNPDGTINDNEVLVMPAGADGRTAEIRNRREQTRAESIERLRGARVRFPNLPDEYLVDDVQSDGTILMRNRRPNQPAPPIINIRTLLNAENALDPALVQITRPAGRGPERADLDPVDLSEAHQMVGHQFDVNIQVVQGRRASILPDPAGGWTTEIILDNDFLKLIPNRTRLTIVPYHEKDINREPALNVDVYATVGGVTYQLGDRSPRGNEKQKRPFLDQLRHSQAQRMAVYDLDGRRFLQFNEVENIGQNNELFKFMDDSSPQQPVEFSKAEMQALDVFKFLPA